MPWDLFIRNLHSKSVVPCNFSLLLLIFMKQVLKTNILKYLCKTEQVIVLLAPVIKTKCAVLYL